VRAIMNRVSFLLTIVVVAFAATSCGDNSSVHMAVQEEPDVGMMPDTRGEDEDKDVDVTPEPDVVDCFPPVDMDCDEVPDDQDNCPQKSNVAQHDFDNDGVGDACDNCGQENEDQLDSVGNGLGDVCECMGSYIEFPSVTGTQELFMEKITVNGSEMVQVGEVRFADGEYTVIFFDARVPSPEGFSAAFCTSDLENFFLEPEETGEVTMTPLGFQFKIPIVIREIRKWISIRLQVHPETGSLWFMIH
jgi:hypothetical protein